MKRVLAFFTLARVGMAPLTISVPLLDGHFLNTFEIIGLGAVGLCAHLFGFGLNGLVDAPLDQTLPGYQHHPFSTGQLTARDARLFIAIQVPLALGIYVGLMGGSRTGTAFLLASIAASVIYNLWSKWGSLPRILPEIGLAASITLLCLSGALLKTNTVLVDSLIFAATLGLILLLLNSLPSGLKDLKTDAVFGARSFVIASGARVQGSDAAHIPRRLQIYGGLLQITVMAGLLASILRREPGLLASGLALLLTIFGALHLRMLLAVRSFTAIRQSKPLLNGYYNYAALLMIRAPQMAIGLKILLGVFTLLLLLLPLRLGWRLWQNRYVLD